MAAPPEKPPNKGKGGSAGQSSEQLIAFDTFETGLDGWPRGGLRVCSAGNAQLGVFGIYGSESVDPIAKTYPVAGKHSHVRIQANVTFLDSWSGETVSLNVDGEEVWVDSWQHCPEVFGTSCRGINVCGDESVADRLGRKIDIILPHTDDSLTLTFKTSLASSNVNRAGLLVDDIHISVF